jgi:protein-ribulosamine 3-kinase
MERLIPIAIREAVADIISRGAPAAITGFIAAQGGCINNGGRLQTTAGNFFLKWNQAAALKGMFEREAKGLQLLRATHAIHVPEVIATDEVANYQFLLIEYIDPQPARHDYWNVMGWQLAKLHRVHGSDYGLDHDNYIGSLPQLNRPHQSWQKFFGSQRLIPLVEKAIQLGKAPDNWNYKFEQLVKKMDSLLPEEAPSLLHGDLWQGNVLINSVGAPCLIDPAVYYGHREVDLAMTQLFDKFDPVFYYAYHEAYPLLAGFEKRFEIYNLYPLLVHLHLFGSSYIAPIQSTLNAFV